MMNWFRLTSIIRAATLASLITHLPIIELWLFVSISIMSLSFSVFPPSLSVLIKVSESCANTSEVPWNDAESIRGKSAEWADPSRRVSSASPLVQESRCKILCSELAGVRVKCQGQRRGGAVCRVMNQAENHACQQPRPWTEVCAPV